MTFAQFCSTTMYSPPNHSWISWMRAMFTIAERWTLIKPRGANDSSKTVERRPDHVATSPLRTSPYHARDRRCWRSQPALAGACSIGEAKWGQVMGLGQLKRLRRVATLLDRRGYDTRDIRLACYSGVGFDADLRTAAGRGEVLLVTPDSLYA